MTTKRNYYILGVYNKTFDDTPGTTVFNSTPLKTIKIISLNYNKFLDPKENFDVFGVDTINMETSYIPYKSNKCEFIFFPNFTFCPDDKIDSLEKGRKIFMEWTFASRQNNPELYCGIDLYVKSLNSDGYNPGIIFFKNCNILQYKFNNNSIVSIQISFDDYIEIY